MSEADYQATIALLSGFLFMAIDTCFWMHGRAFTDGPSPSWSFMPGGGILRCILGK